MDRARCPGQDMRSWKPEDIFDVVCPGCATEIEFWKDEPFRSCPTCSIRVQNPRLDLGCTEWCDQAEACTGSERVAEALVALRRDRRVGKE
jgi:hypothetical protein